MIPDESTLSRLVAARLDLPVSQRLLDKNFKLSIIKRCWEDQLRIKREFINKTLSPISLKYFLLDDDFACEVDLYIACLILRKQFEYIDGKKENIIIPSIKMKQLKEETGIVFILSLLSVLSFIIILLLFGRSIWKTTKSYTV